MVDLKKNEIMMKEAWREVTKDGSPINWALFGYEGQTNVLRLISQGEDGLEELTEDLNPSAIMYGFVRVEDPKTSLPKYVILNWQGETAPGSRKGVCAMHLRDIERFLPGHHLTVNVRNEDDIDLDSLIKKVSEITGSSYNFKEKPQGMEHSPEPVGTAHKKINPLQELPKLSEREQFWSKDQDEEKRRIQGERERRVQEMRRVEEERKSREEIEKTARESQIKEKERKVSVMREQEKGSVEASMKMEKSKWDQQQEEDAMEARVWSQRSERMRQERAKEAQELIQNRSGEARKIFTRNSSQGQMSVPRMTPPSIAPKVGSMVAATQSQLLQSGQAAQPQPNTGPRPRGDQAAVFNQESAEVLPVNNTEVPEVWKEPSPSNIAPPPGFQENDDSTELSDSPSLEVDLTPTEEDIHHATPLNLEKETSLESYGVCAVSLYDYQASDETEISFDPGQIITHIDQIDPGWWQGLGPDGSYGLFPANYVEIIDNSELQIQT